jgi:hypothetical protein
MLGGLSGWHLIISTVVFFIPWLLSIIQIAVSRGPATPVVVWILVVTLIPLVGPILWLTIGRGSLRRERPPVQ